MNMHKYTHTVTYFSAISYTGLGVLSQKFCTVGPDLNNDRGFHKHTQYTNCIHIYIAHINKGELAAYLCD